MTRGRPKVKPGEMEVKFDRHGRVKAFRIKGPPKRRSGGKWLSRHKDGKHFLVGQKAAMTPMKFVSGVAGVSAGLMALRAARGGKIKKGQVQCPYCGHVYYPAADDQYLMDRGHGLDCPKCGRRFLADKKYDKRADYGVRIELAGTVGDIKERSDLKLVTDSQEVREILDFVGAPHHFGGLFVKEKDGEYAEVYGFHGSVPYTYSELFAIKRYRKGGKAQSKKWVVKKYKQSKTQTPQVVEQQIFGTEKEAIEFYKRNKRTSGWPWNFWAYPEEAVSGAKDSIDAIREKLIQESLRKFKKEHGVRSGGKVKQFKKYRVYEGNKVLLETDDKVEAEKVWRDSHRKTPGKFHELHRWSPEEGHYEGISQFAPGDKVRW